MRGTNGARNGLVNVQSGWFGTLVGPSGGSRRQRWGMGGRPGAGGGSG